MAIEAPRSAPFSRLFSNTSTRPANLSVVVPCTWVMRPPMKSLWPRLVLRGHARETDQGPRVLDLAHVAKCVLVDPALQRVTSRDAALATDARGEGLGDARTVGVGHN